MLFVCNIIVKTYYVKLKSNKNGFYHFVEVILSIEATFRSWMQNILTGSDETKFV